MLAIQGACRAREAISSMNRCEEARACSVGGSGRFPHRKLADPCLHGRDVAGGGDGNRVRELILVEFEQAPSRDGACDRIEHDMIPAALSRTQRVGQPAMHLVPDGDGIQQATSVELVAFGNGEGYAAGVAWMHCLRRQIDVAVVEIANREAVDEGCRLERHPLRRADDRRARRGRVATHGLESQRRVAGDGNGCGRRGTGQTGERINDGSQHRDAYRGAAIERGARNEGELGDPSGERRVQSETGVRRPGSRCCRRATTEA